ncbi:MAG: hypothetical protein J6Y82_03815 [Bacteroidales bacterium]|nr:hypothetical protein [Bacteroidales bacterium]
MATLLLSACANNNEPTTEPAATLPAQNADNGDVIVADTIRYNVNVIPIEDYEVESLAHLEKQKLVDMIFESIYMHQADVHDFSTGEKLSMDDVKTREIEDPRFARELVSALQFTEKWAYNTTTQHFTKDIISVHVAYAVFDDTTFVAHRAGIVVTMR